MNETKAQHAPVPWHVLPPDSDDRRWFIMRTVGVADVPPEKFYICILSCGDDRRDQADARHIVRCVNSHDDLVAACDDAIDLFERLQTPGSPPWEYVPAEVAKLRAAIAKAKGA
jgi:hypothetical protein